MMQVLDRLKRNDHVSTVVGNTGKVLRVALSVGEVCCAEMLVRIFRGRAVDVKTANTLGSGVSKRFTSIATPTRDVDDISVFDKVGCIPVSLDVLVLNIRGEAFAH